MIIRHTLSTVLSRICGRMLWPRLPDLPAGATVLCHEWLTTVGGSDKVAAEIARATGARYVFTLAARPGLVDELGIEAQVVESRIGRLVRDGRRWQLLLPAMPILWWSLDLRRAATVVTSSHAFVNYVRAAPGRKLSYCHTPMRYAWEWQLELGRVPRPLRPVWPLFAGLLRRLDRRASATVDRFVANSQYVANRVEECYNRRSVVVNPPIDLGWWTPSGEPREDFVLYAGRCVGYKRPDLAFAAARRAGRRIVVAGDGPLLAELARNGDGTVTVVPSPSDDELRDLYRRCLALVFPAIEDFGMVPVEAQACGAPVVGIRAGGTLETVQDGATGVLVGEQTGEALGAAIARVAAEPFEVLPGATARFGRERFEDEIRREVERLGYIRRPRAPR